MTSWAVERRDVLAAPWPLDDESVQSIVTSPPYWGLRDYKARNQIGLEGDVYLYVDRLVRVFREARRVLRKDGTLWLNLGDCYAGSGKAGGRTKTPGNGYPPLSQKQASNAGSLVQPQRVPAGLKPKDLIGVPWRVAFALQADGWWLRAEIIWAKPNPMPESVSDRPTRAHEQVFLLSRSRTYFYDANAIREPYLEESVERFTRRRSPGHKRDDGRGWSSDRSEAWNARSEAMRSFATKARTRGDRGFDTREDIPGQRPRRSKTAETPHAGGRRQAPEPGEANAFHPMGRNKRSVWTIPPAAYEGDHFSTFPCALVQPCILAGTREGDLVLDPFVGSGTTVMVAVRCNRRGVGFDIDRKNVNLARGRILNDAPLFNHPGPDPQRELFSRMEGSTE